MILQYLACLLISTNIIFVWFNSSISIHIFGPFLEPNKKNRSIMTFEELMDLLDEKSQFLAELLSCPVCLASWVCLFVSIIQRLFFDVPFWYPFLTVFSIPFLAYRLSNTKRNN